MEPAPPPRGTPSPRTEAAGDDGRATLGGVAALVLGGCVLAVFIAALSWYHSASIERALRDRVVAHLAGHGFDDVSLRIDGRVVMFTGEVEARVDRARMLALAAEVDGVERVLDQRVVTNYEVGRHFELHSYAGITTVAGELPHVDDVAAVFAAIRDHFGVDPLGADLKVNAPVRRPPWLDRLTALLDATGEVSPLQIEYADDTMTVAGEVADREVRERVTRQLNALLGDDTALRVHLRLPSQVRQPELRIEYKNGRVSVSGTVPEDEFADELAESLRLAFGVEEIDNDLRADPDVQHASYLQSVLRIVFPLAMTRWVDLTIGPDEVRANGRVGSDDELAILAEQLRDNFSYTGRVVNLIRRQADGR